MRKLLIAALVLVVGLVAAVQYTDGGARLGAVVVENVSHSFDSVEINGTSVIDSSRNGSFAALTATGAVTASGAVSGLEPTTTLTGTTTITTASTDRTYYITGGGAYTLPVTASSAGIAYRFVIASAITQDAIITSAGGSSGDDIEGSLIVAGAIVDCTANDVVTFVSDGEDLGDFVTLRSNGSKWFVSSSNGLTASKLTCSG